MTTTYLAATAAQPLAAAQRLLDAHALVLPDGVCRLCGTSGSCGYRDAAQAAFAWYRRLPVRRPGASRPELVSARRMGVA
jgi:hypothetical protein